MDETQKQLIEIMNKIMDTIVLMGKPQLIVPTSPKLAKVKQAPFESNDFPGLE